MASEAGTANWSLDAQPHNHSKADIRSARLQHVELGLGGGTAGKTQLAGVWSKERN